jgi:hypothetical protein
VSPASGGLEHPEARALVRFTRTGCRGRSRREDECENRECAERHGRSPGKSGRMRLHPACRPRGLRKSLFSMQIDAGPATRQCSRLHSLSLGVHRPAWSASPRTVNSKLLG